MKGRRRKLRVSEIINEQEKHIKAEDQIGNAVVQYYSNQFTVEAHNGDYGILEHIPNFDNR